MCLLKTESRPKYATEPIKVYKILQMDDRSPFRYQYYHKGINTPIDIPDLLTDPDSSFVAGGYLHAYLNRGVAEYMSECLLKECWTGPVITKIVEMYIPKDTEYWLGEGDTVAAAKLEWPKDAQ